MERRRFKQTTSLDSRPTAVPGRMRTEAHGMSPEILRDKLIRRSRQAKPASQMQNRVNSSALQKPV
jgi:hypothetical protein